MAVELDVISVMSEQVHLGGVLKLAVYVMDHVLMPPGLWHHC